MKRSDLTKIIVAAALAAIISFVISSSLFNSPAKHNQTVPQLQPITTTFPDVANDPVLKTIFNTKALDPTQPVKVGGTPNSTPFGNSGTQ